MIVILDAGHGGMIDGVYQTLGKRSPIWSDGSQYFEGVGNRQIVKKLTSKLIEKGVEVFNANKGEEDMPLSKRVSIINDEIKANPDREYIGVSVHSNGFKNERASGWEVYAYSNGSIDSFVLAYESEKSFVNYFTELNRGVKTSNFYILKNTICPFILTENFFHTNERECKDILMTESGQDKIVNMHFDFICEFLGIE